MGEAEGNLWQSLDEELRPVFIEGAARYEDLQAPARTIVKGRINEHNYLAFLSSVNKAANLTGLPASEIADRALEIAEEESEENIDGQA